MATADRSGDRRLGRDARRCLLGLAVASRFLVLGASNGSAGSDRPRLQPWARQLQHYFDQLPGVGTAVPPTRVEGCAARAKIFGEARAKLIPAPTPEIEAAFRAYIE